MANAARVHTRGCDSVVGYVTQQGRAVSALPVIATNATTAPFAQAGKEGRPTHARNLSRCGLTFIGPTCAQQYADYTWECDEYQAMRESSRSDNLLTDPAD